MENNTLLDLAEECTSNLQAMKEVIDKLDCELFGAGHVDELPEPMPSDLKAQLEGIKFDSAKCYEALFNFELKIRTSREGFTKVTD